MTDNDTFDELYGGKYLKAADLQGRRVHVIIDRTDVQQFNDGKRKMVIFFAGKDKGVVLNKTNAERLAYAFGKDPRSWIGGAMRPIQIHVRDMQRKVRLPGLTTADAIHAACNALVEAGWLGQPSAGTGFQQRGKEAYPVSPRLNEMLP